MEPDPDRQERRAGEPEDLVGPHGEGEAGQEDQGGEGERTRRSSRRLGGRSRSSDVQRLAAEGDPERTPISTAFRVPSRRTARDLAEIPAARAQATVARRPPPGRRPQSRRPC